MKKKIASLVLLLISFTFVLVGCGTSLVMPASSAAVVGNGGFVVQKGEYLYFANAYTEYSTIGTETSNDEGKVVEYALYRTKLSSVSNKTITYDENGYPQNVELVVSKLVGFENSGFYIVGDYLIYASPNMHKNSNNQNRYDLVSIWSVKLDGTSSNELYTTSDYTNGQWRVLTITESNVTTNYLITVEGSSVIRHKIVNGNLQEKTTLVDNATAVVLASEVKYTLDKYIYFTTERNAADTESGITGNLLKRVNIQTGVISDLATPSGTTITLVKHENGIVFYSKSTAVQNDYYFYRDISGQEKQLTSWTDLTNFFFLGYDVNGDPTVVVYTYQSSLVMQNLNSYELTVLSTSSVTPFMTDGDYVYYKTSTGIARMSYKDQVEQIVVEATITDGQYDFDGRYLYVYANIENTTTETNYIQRVDTFSIIQGTPKVLKNVGYILDEDIPDEE